MELLDDDDDFLDMALAILNTDGGQNTHWPSQIASAASTVDSLDCAPLLQSLAHTGGTVSLPSVFLSIEPRASEGSSNPSRLGKRKKPVTVNRSRNRKREELEYLRDTVQTLEAQLLSLEQRIPANAESSQLQHGATSSSGSGIWKDLALRQLEQRERSEIRNRKLRKTLEDQLQLAHGLKKLLKKATNPEQLSLLPPPHSVESQPKLHPESIFQRLQDDLISMHSSVDLIFIDPRFFTISNQSRDARVCRNEHLGAVVEITGSTSVPFDLSSTSRAVWHQTLSHTMQKGSFYEQVISDAGHAVREEFHVEMQLGGHTGSVRGKIAARKFVEQNRVVIVWSAYAEPVKIADTKMEGLVLRHKGWTLIEQEETQDMTRIKTFQLAVPEATLDSPDIHRKVGVLTDFVLSAVDVQLDATQQMIENHLLEQAHLPEEEPCRA